MDRRPDFAWEPLARLVCDPALGELLRAHYDAGEPDKAVCALDPDWGYFLGAAKAGTYRVWTARNRHRTLVGYVSLYVQPHMHFRGALHATGDLALMAPPWRGWFYAMLAALEKELRAMGVVRWFMSDRPAGALATIYNRLGFAHTENVYAKVL